MVAARYPQASGQPNNITVFPDSIENASWPLNKSKTKESTNTAIPNRKVVV